MKELFVGIDVGSVSVNLAVMNRQKKVLKDYYIRIEGEPLLKTHTALKDIFLNFKEESIAGMAATGSGGKLVSSILNIPFVNEIITQTKSTGFFNPEVKTIIEIGGEDSKFITVEFDPVIGSNTIKDFSMNTICAAGTGSFLDHQASRMGYTIEEFGNAALKCEVPPRIAGRCSVFAKTDMIHLQQEATPDFDIIAGLCFALARNFKSTIAKNKEFKTPISFQGGVAANKGIVRAFKEVLELKDIELIIPEYYASMGAIGAALTIIEKPKLITKWNNIEELLKYSYAQKNGGNRLEPLAGKEEKVDKLTREQVDKGINQEVDKETSRQGNKATKKINVCLGVDVGSVSTNVVAIDEDKNLVARKYLLTASRPIEAVRQGIEEVGKEIKDLCIVKGAGTTGSGRYMIGDLIGADIIKNEITAQAQAAAEYDKNVDTIFEIGGQDSKFISLQNGVVSDFEMNKVCAAGTGSFLEEQADRLGISIKEEFGKLALNSKNPTHLGERCTVFMETDLVNHQQRNTAKEDLVAGLSYSIVNNYLTRVVGDRKIGEKVFFQGAVALNKGVVRAFEKVTGKKIIVPPNNDVTGAIGAALLAKQYIEKNKIEKSNFKGFGFSSRKYNISTFECKGCANICDIKKVEVEGEKPLYYGSRCEKYEVGKIHKADTGLTDLFKEREELLLKSYYEKSETAQIHPRIGIPRILGFFELMPLWVTVLKELGFEVVLSDATNKNIIHNGVESVVSEHCFPIKVAHGHILNLIEKECHFIFFPNVINLEAEFHGINKSYACPFVQASPDIIKAALSIEEKEIEFISPAIYLRKGKKFLEKTLYQTFGKKFKILRKNIKQAVEKGYTEQKEFFVKTKARGKEILKNLTKKSMVIVGRPYNTCDPGLNIEIPKRLLDMGIQAIPIDYLEFENIKLFDEWPNMYWKYGQRILAALRVIKKNPKLFPLYITNFGCGPDSFILKYFAKEMGKKPYLSIEVDEHSAGAGVITRCEAFFDSLENVDEVTEEALSDKGIISSSPKKDSLANRTLYVPYMGDQSYIVAASFRACGIDSSVMPIPDERSIELGKKHTSGKECYPCILTIGEMVKIVQSPSFDPTKTAFFMPASSGPCRFGQYSKWQRIILDELGYPDVPILSPNQCSNFYATIASYGKDFDRRAWFGICATEILQKLRREIKPYELIEGETKKVYQDCLSFIEEAVENGGIYKYKEIIKKIRNSFKEIKVDKKHLKPLIGIVGEIYVRSSGFANDYIIESVEALGGEAWVSPTTEWFYYTNMHRMNDFLNDHEYLEAMKDKIKDIWQRAKERDMEIICEDILRNIKEPHIEKILEYSDPYLSKKVEGEAVLSVGKAIDYIKRGACGIINVMPFTCMPGTNVSAVLMKVKKDFNGIPVLNMAYDGLSQLTAKTRLEAFMYQAEQFNNKTVQGTEYRVQRS